MNTKYRAKGRDGERRLWQKAGGIKTPFNANIFLDHGTFQELSESEDGMLIWTEGEFDCLAAVQVGFPHTVSLPEGSVAARDSKGRPLPPVPTNADDIDPNDDDKFLFFARHAERLALIKNHLIATDGDEAGQRMAQEMARRIGPARCFHIVYPDDEVVPDADAPGGMRRCKDFNEVLHHLGRDRLHDLIYLAPRYPVRGIYKLSQYPDQETPQTIGTGISPLLDEMFKPYTPAFTVLTGQPNIGKSTLAKQMAVGMAKLHRWPIGIFAGEEAIKPFVARSLMTAFLNKPAKEWTFSEEKLARAFVERYFVFIDSDPSGGEDDDINMRFLLDSASTACFRYGIKGLLVDPFNEIDDSDRPPHVSQTQWVGQSIKGFKRFGRSHDCHVMVVAHPTKLAPGVVPDLYDISDSAHWKNKPDFGLSLHAADPLEDDRELHVQKVRHTEFAGSKGVVPLGFDRTKHLFVPRKVDPMAEVRQPAGPGRQKPDWQREAAERRDAKKGVDERA